MKQDQENKEIAEFHRVSAFPCYIFLRIKAMCLKGLEIIDFKRPASFCPNSDTGRLPRPTRAVTRAVSPARLSRRVNPAAGDGYRLTPVSFLVYNVP